MCLHQKLYNFQKNFKSRPCLSCEILRAVWKWLMTADLSGEFPTYRFSASEAIHWSVLKNKNYRSYHKLLIKKNLLFSVQEIPTQRKRKCKCTIDENWQYQLPYEIDWASETHSCSMLNAGKRVRILFSCQVIFMSKMHINSQKSMLAVLKVKVLIRRNANKTLAIAWKKCWQIFFRLRKKPKLKWSVTAIFKKISNFETQLLLSVLAILALGINDAPLKQSHINQPIEIYAAEQHVHISKQNCVGTNLYHSKCQHAARLSLLLLWHNHSIFDSKFIQDVIISIYLLWRVSFQIEIQQNSLKWS